MRTPLLLLALAAGLTAQSPTALTILPSDGATNVPRNARVLVAVSYPATYYTQVTIKVTKAGVPVSGATLPPEKAGLAPPQGAFGWFAFIPRQAFDPNTRYDVEVAAPNRPSSLSSFTTGSSLDSTPLRLESSDPSPGQDAVNRSGQAILRFNKPVDPFSFSRQAFTLRDLGTGYALAFSPQAKPDGATITFPFADGSALPLGHAFRIEYSGSGVTDWLGNQLSPAPAPIVFTTFRSAEKTGPALQGSAPADGDTGVPMNSAVVLLFDKPLAQLPMESAVSVDAGGPVKFTLERFGVERALAIRPAVLLPPNTQVTVRVSGLVDAFGGSQSAPLTIGFRTGALPETQPLQMTTPIQPIYPANGLVQTAFNRPIDAVLLPLIEVTLRPAGVYSATGRKVPASLSGDGRTLRITPDSPLPPGRYAASLFVPFDRFTGKLQEFGLSFTVSGDPDTTPPQVLAVNPPDGTTDAPPSVVLQVAFSEPVLVASATPFALRRDGSPVAGSFTVNGSSGRFVPAAPLSASGNYQIAISGLTDLAGNQLQPFSSSFATNGAASSDRFQVVAVDPPAKATGVEPSTSVTLTFNRTVNPASVHQGDSQTVLYNAWGRSYVPGSYRVDRETVTFTPAAALRPETYNVIANGITDLSGTYSASFSSSFQVSSATTDTAGPTVLSVSPEDGGSVLYGQAYVVFTFSEQLDPSTVTDANFLAFGPKGLLAVTPVLLAGQPRVAVTFREDPGALVTLYVNPGVTDAAGNAATPFRTTVRISDGPADGMSVQIRPGNYFSSPPPANIPPDTGITLLFGAPVDRASVEQGLLISANSEIVDGTVVWAPDSTGLTFYAAKPYPYSAKIQVIVIAPARDAEGNPFVFDNGSWNTLEIRAAPTPPRPDLAVIASNLPPSAGRVPLDFVIDLVFNQDVPAGFANPAAATLTNIMTGPDRGDTIACTATLIQPRVIRFRPQRSPRPDTAYEFVFDSGTGVKYLGYPHAGVSAAESDPHIVGASPAGRAVPLNSLVAVAFSSRVSYLAMPAGVVLRHGDTVVATEFQRSEEGRSVTLWPSGLLLPDTDYTVTVSGFEDLAGHPIAPRTWTFHTSTVIDQQPASVIRVDPSGTGASPNSTIAVTFSEPVSANWIEGFRVRDSAMGDVAGDARFSADQRTVFFVPAQPLRPGGTIAVSVPSQIGDFAGNRNNGGVRTQGGVFRVAFQVPSAPAILAATPRDGSTAVPVNAKIQVLFDQPVSGLTLDGLQLLREGSPVAVETSVEPDGQIVTIKPPSLLAANSAYTLAVAGVKSPSGEVMAGSLVATFTTGEHVQTASPPLRSSPAHGQTEVPLDAVLRVRSGVPLNGVTVNQRNVTLQNNPLGAIPVEVQLQDSGYTVEIRPVAPLARHSQYTLTLTGVTDLAGNRYSDRWYPDGPLTVTFSTTSGAEKSPAALLALDPPDGSTVLPQVSMQALFNQPVDGTRNDPWLLTGPAGPVAGKHFIEGTTLRFWPARPLADGAYHLALRGIADVGGTPLPEASSSFTVDSASGNSLPLRLLSSTPASRAAGVDVSSPITLTFDRPVSALSAAQIEISSGGADIPGVFHTEGATVTFTPQGALPGAATVTIRGTVRDLQGVTVNFYLEFTTGANPDTTPPFLEFASPGNGDVVPASHQILLRMSEPVLLEPGAFRVFAGSTDVSAIAQFMAGEDGRIFTATLNWSLRPETEILIASQTGIRDFAGNPLTPFSIRYRTLPEAESRALQVASVSPAAGGLNVPVNQPVEVRFTRAADSSSVQSSLHVTEASGVVPGAITADASGRVFSFQPAVSYRNDSVVAVDVEKSVYTTSGERIANEWHGSFTTAPAPGSSTRAVAFSASANAMDVRFNGPAGAAACEAYLHAAGTRIPTACTVTGDDQIRITPEAPLTAGADYHLVLDAAQEIAFRVDAPTSAEPAALPSTRMDDSGAITLRFRERVNPLSVSPRNLRLTTAAGDPIAFTTLRSLDGAELQVIPESLEPGITISIDGLESRSGRRMTPMRVVLRPQSPQ